MSTTTTHKQCPVCSKEIPKGTGGDYQVWANGQWTSAHEDCARDRSAYTKNTTRHSKPTLLPQDEA
ncbi:hypothetical protein LCGC14_2506000 [marine sediment metagenome]|uniref:Uncharacterized protein n=1 Tax=marine sediment metagenome TaxID=412755 RepID=A0A0F9BNJ8_9ZZZZ